jgi:hypothetical protein
MAVYKQNYKGYSGAVTARWSRFSVVTRYGYTRLFQSRMLMIFIAVCLVPPLAGVAFVYLSHNPLFLALLNIRNPALVAIDGRFFYFYCLLQGAMAYLLTSVVGPSQWRDAAVSLPTVLARGICRREILWALTLAFANYLDSRTASFRHSI